MGSLFLEPYLLFLISYALLSSDFAKGGEGKKKHTLEELYQVSNLKPRLSPTPLSPSLSYIYKHNLISNIALGNAPPVDRNLDKWVVIESPVAMSMHGR